jgi:hypothetical protein
MDTSVTIHKEMHMKKDLASVFLTMLLAASLCAARTGDRNSKSTPKAADKATIDALISDEKCGANVNAECSKKCQEQGVKLVVVNTKDKSIMPVANQDSLKGLAGQHVTVTGTVKDGILTVATVKRVK